MADNTGFMQRVLYRLENSDFNENDRKMGSRLMSK